MAIYRIYNGASPTTAKFVAMTTGTAIKTLLQISTSATKAAKIVEWGFKCDAPASACLAHIELIETGAVPATSLTAHVTAGLIKYGPEALGGGDPVTNLIPVGTSATGFHSGASAEGTITATRLLDVVLTTIPSTNGYEFVKQLPLGRDPGIPISTFLRVRVHFSVAVNAVTYVDVEV